MRAINCTCKLTCMCVCTCMCSRMCLVEKCVPVENIKNLLTFWCFRGLEAHNIGVIRLPATLVCDINSSEAIIPFLYPIKLSKNCGFFLS